MGSSSLLKLVGTFLIGGLILLNINRLTAHINQDTNERVVDSITQQTADGIVQLLEFDLNRLGLRVHRQELSIISAGPHAISFYSDFDENNVIERVSYWLSDSTAASSTENPHDCVLYRVVQGESTTDLCLGVTAFNLRYFDWFGNETANLEEIKTIEVNLEVQSIFAVDDYTSTLFYHTRITPPNLMRY